jgi:hypothetical protein
MPEPTPLDYRILREGGTTSTIDILPHRLQKTKQERTDGAHRIEDLTHVNEYLLYQLHREFIHSSWSLDRLCSPTTRPVASVHPR